METGKATTAEEDVAATGVGQTELESGPSGKEETAVEDATGERAVGKETKDKTGKRKRNMRAKKTRNGRRKRNTARSRKGTKLKTIGMAEEEETMQESPRKRIGRKETTKKLMRKQTGRKEKMEERRWEEE